MTWPPPGFAQPCAQRGLRVLVHAGHPYISTRDLADWLRTQTKGARPLVQQTAETIADEIKRLGELAELQRAQWGEDQGELPAGGSVPQPLVLGPLDLRPLPKVAEGVL